MTTCWEVSFGFLAYTTTAYTQGDRGSHTTLTRNVVRGICIPQEGGPNFNRKVTKILMEAQL